MINMRFLNCNHNFSDAFFDDDNISRILMPSAYTVYQLLLIQIIETSQQIYQPITHMSEEKVYQSIPISQTTMKRYSVMRVSKQIKSNSRKLEKLYTEGTYNSVKRSHNQISMHRHVNNLHLNGYPSTHKTKQQIIQQNFELKNQNNQLKKQLSSLKILNQNQKKKNRNFTSKLNRQFKKDFYYSGSQKIENSMYLMTGIKNQYEHLKQEHEALVSDYQSLKRTDFVQQANQFRILAEALQQENKRLTQKIILLKSKSEGDPQEKLELKNSELELKIQKLSNKIKSLKDQIKELRKQDSEHKKVIDFLQKIILGKDNAEHHANKNSKNYLKKKEELQKKLKTEEQQSLYLVQQYQTDMESLKNKYEERLKKENQMNRKAIETQNQTIKKLEKELSYVSTLLSYWKPTNEHENNKERADQEKRIEHKRKMTEENPELIKLQETERNQQSNAQKKIEPEIIQNEQEFRNSENSNQISHREEKPATRREKKSSAVKRSEQAKKMRKVSKEEISELPEHLKFRMIGENVSMDQLQEYFKAPEQFKQGDIQYEYISHREMFNILKNKPFCLKQKEAFLLTRYIIEDECEFQKGDPNNSFVYLDEENQISRRIAKSIIRAFINEYDLKDFNKCKEEWKSIWGRNGAKVETALNSIGPHGQVSQDKWNDVVQGFITGQISQGVKNWIVGIMLLGSESLSKLKYNIAIEIGK